MTQRSSNFADRLKPATVEFDSLQRAYPAHLELGRHLLGAIPSCYPYLEIWPTSFRSYNLMLPNLLNIPFSLFGGPAPVKLVSLAMYVSSRAAECMYCSAHCCALSLRQGSVSDRLANAKMADGSNLHSPAEQAMIAVAAGMSTVPHTLKSEDTQRLREHFSPAAAEWIILSVSMMGFLNKYMDAMGFNLEDEVVQAVEGVITTSGWSPGRHQVVTPPGVPLPHNGRSLRLKLGMLPHMPKALALDMRWTKGVPATWPKAGVFLKEQTGYDFPMLGKLKHKRAIRALATILRDNLIEQTSAAGHMTKLLTGYVFGRCSFNEQLTEASRALATRADPDLPDSLFDALDIFAGEPTKLEDPEQLREAERLTLEDIGSSYSLNARTFAGLFLAKAVSTNPADTPNALMDRCTSDLTPPMVIELITWISVLSMLNRLTVYQEVAAA